MKTLMPMFLVVAAIPVAACNVKADDAGKLPRLTNSIGMKFVRIPAGEFLMGAPDSAKYAEKNERPQHRVRITKPFAPGVYEVTRLEFQKIMGGDPKLTEDKHRHPVVLNQWKKCVEFCDRLSALPAEKKAKRSYRLPTEAEWEYACRAGTTTVVCYGDSLSSVQANFNGNHPFGDAPKGPHLKAPTRVGSYKPNAFGLYDMHGNVWEWCADWLDDGYYAKSPVDDPPGPASAKYHVVRGGGYFYTGEYCRSGHRSHPIRAGIGFRVVCVEK